MATDFIKGLWEDMQTDFILDDGTDCSDCICGAFAIIDEDLTDVFGHAIKITEDMYENRESIAAMIFDALEEGTTDYDGEWYEKDWTEGSLSAGRWEGESLGPLFDTSPDQPGCKCLYLWEQGNWLNTKEYMYWHANYATCPDDLTAEDAETELDYESSFEGIIRVNEDAYGFADSWRFTKSLISDDTFNVLDSGEIGIMKTTYKLRLCTDSDEDGILDTCEDTEYNGYSAVFDHAQPEFANLEAVDATNYTAESSLSDVETAALKELYGASSEDATILVTSYIESIADTIATAAGETGQPLNKIKYVQIDEDMFDAIGAEEGKETMAVETVKETTYEA